MLSRSTWGQRVLQGRQRRRAIHFYSSFIGPGDLCFDVGANIGNRTAIFNAVGAKVVAVEPQALCVAELRKRFEGQANVIIESTAIGSEEGTADIAICDQDTTISTMSERWRTEGRFSDREWAGLETVDVTTLDRLIETHGTPRFCKIDVEGFEKQVLEGISSPLPCTSFEFTQEFLGEAKACVDLLAGAGPVTVNYSIGESMRLMGDWVSPSELFASIEKAAGDWGDIYVRSC